MRALILVALALVAAPTTAAHSGTSCSAVSTMTTGCGIINEDTVTITATETHTAPSGNDSPDTQDPTPPQQPKDKPCHPKPTEILTCGITAVRITNPDNTPLTITDVAQYAPTPTPTTAEPHNLGIAGLPTNLTNPTTTQTRTGTLLGRPITVRFTPTTYDFTHGDGTTTTTTTGGHTWTQLHQPQFTPTPTSHTYNHRGTYTTHTTIHYTAELNIGNGWFPLPGELTIPTPTQQIHIYQATTALVTHTCTEQPTAPGC